MLGMSRWPQIAIDHQKSRPFASRNHHHCSQSVVITHPYSGHGRANQVAALRQHARCRASPAWVNAGHFLGNRTAGVHRASTIARTRPTNGRADGWMDVPHPHPHPHPQTQQHAHAPAPAPPAQACIARHSTARHRTTSQRIAPHRTSPHLTTLHRTVWHGMAWH